MIERVSALPGVMSAGAIDHMPLRFGMEVAPFSIVGSRPPTGDPIEIVGVVEDGKYQSLGEDPTLAVFVPLSQRYGSWTTVTPLPLGQGLRAIRDAVLQLDPALTLFNTGTLKDQLALPFFPVRVAVSVLGTFGLIAVVLSATGVFALVAYAVSRRTREIGIRIAMGAGCGQVLRAVLARTLALWIAGSCLGTAMALAASRLLSSMLYGVSPSDPVAYGLALLLMATVALLACWYPAYRAMRVNPALTLRQE